MPNIADSINIASEILRKNKIAKPIKEANSLLSFALQKDRTFLIAHNDYELSNTENERFCDIIKRRSNREPFQHIVGKQEFWGLDFKVSKDVLIPRPETEIIVEHSIKILQEFENPEFCEIGIGTGCISISILHDIKKATARTVDISAKAIAIAKQNASEHGILNRLNIQISDVFEAFDNSDKFDLIVSNPPYIALDDFGHLQKEVRDFDPKEALTDGEDGFSIIKKIINNSPKHLKPNSFLLMEIGFNQSKKVRKMFDQRIWQNIEFIADLQGIPRVVKAKLV